MYKWMVESENGVSDIWIVFRNNILKLFSFHLLETHPENISWKTIPYASRQIHPKLKIYQNVTCALFALNHSNVYKCKACWVSFIFKFKQVPAGDREQKTVKVWGESGEDIQQRNMTAWKQLPQVKLHYDNHVTCRCHILGLCLRAVGISWFCYFQKWFSWFPLF